jgi:hypothetical protein
MERHFSTGVMTIVALMTAHRTLIAEDAEARPQALPEIFGRINDYLSERDERCDAPWFGMPAE